MASISLKNIIKRYGRGKHAVQVLHGVSAEIADREFIVIVGPSGPVPATDRADGLIDRANSTSFGGFSCPPFPVGGGREQKAEGRTLTLMARRQRWAKWQA